MRYILALLLLAGCGGSNLPSANAAAGNDIEIVIINVIGDGSLDWQAIHNHVMPEVIDRYNSEQLLTYTFKAYAEVTDLDKGWLYQFEPYGFTQKQRLSWCDNYIKENFETRPWRMHFCIFPPMKDTSGEKLFGGMAWMPGRSGIGQCGFESSHNPPRSRVQGCCIVIGHETRHNQSAEHLGLEQHGPNIMYQGAGIFVDSHGCNLPALELTRFSIDTYWTFTKRKRTRKIRRRCGDSSKCVRRLRRHQRRYPRPDATLLNVYM